MKTFLTALAVKTAQHPVTTITTIASNPWLIGAVAVGAVAVAVHEASQA